MTQYRLGSILMDMGLLNQSQLDAALQKQHQQVDSVGWQLLGELLIGDRVIRPKDLDTALERQAQLIEQTLFNAPPHPSTRNPLKRGLDIVGSLVGLAILLVLLPFVALAIWLTAPGSIFVAQPRVGLRGKQFKLWRFRTTTPNAEQQRQTLANQQGRKFFEQREDPQVTPVGKLLRRFYIDEVPQFLNVLKGEMSLVGTRPPTLDEVKFYNDRDWQRLAVKPGMTGRWQVHRDKYRMSFDEIAAMDSSYINRWQIYSDLQILTNTAFHIMVGPQPDRLEGLRVASEINKVSILSVPIDNFSMQEFLEELKSGFVLTPNVDHLMKLEKDAEFANLYALADYRVCDSQILMYASKFLGTPLKEKISGSDLFPIFCDYHRDNENIKIFLLGGREGVADQARIRINSKIGREIIVDSYSPSFGFEKREDECQYIIDLINRSDANVLAVGVGSPKQEKWIHKYRDQLKEIEIFFAVGATIDFEAGTVQRAPKWMSKLGIEWLYRIYADPKRLWKRYLVEDLPFFWLLLRQKLGLYKPPTFSSMYRSNEAVKNSSQDLH